MPMITVGAKWERMKRGEFETMQSIKQTVASEVS